MAFVDAKFESGEIGRASLTGPMAIRLAENALKAGRTERALRYVNLAYAIFDAASGSGIRDAVSALHRSSD